MRLLAAGNVNRQPVLIVIIEVFSFSYSLAY